MSAQRRGARARKRTAAPRIRSDVTLAPLTHGHAAATYHWMLDPEVSRNLGLRSEPTLQRTSDWFEAALADPSICAFAVLLRDTHVGNVVLDRTDAYLRTARLSVYVGEPSARGSGVGRAAVCLAAGHAFDRLGLHKLWLTVHVQNAAAVAMYVRAGFLQEGVLRDEFILDGQRVDVLYMGLLRSQFRLQPEPR